MKAWGRKGFDALEDVRNEAEEEGDNVREQGQHRPPQAGLCQGVRMKTESTLGSGESSSRCSALSIWGTEVPLQETGRQGQHI